MECVYDGTYELHEKRLVGQFKNVTRKIQEIVAGGGAGSEK